MNERCKIVGGHRPPKSSNSCALRMVGDATKILVFAEYGKDFPFRGLALGQIIGVLIGGIFRAKKFDLVSVIPSRIKILINSEKSMLRTVEGIYRNGQIEFTDLHNNVSNLTQVLVTFLDADKIDPTKLRQLIDQLETIAGIQQGFEELNAGQTRPIGDFVQGMQQKYDISG